MPSRGTMGIRMSRIRVDDVLNISTLRAYASQTVRYTDPGNFYFNNAAYAIFAQKQIPSEYLYPSTFVMLASVGAQPGKTTSVQFWVDGLIWGEKSFLNSGGAYAETGLYLEVSTPITTGAHTLKWYAKTDDAVQGARLFNLKIACGNESVIDGKNPGTW